MLVPERSLFIGGLMIEVFNGVRSSVDCPDDFIGSSSGDGRVFKSVYCDSIDRYVSFWSSKEAMPFHIYMVDFILSVLPPSSSLWVADRLDTIDGSSSRSVPDLIWNNIFFEAETGLKRSVKPLIRRFKKYRKFFYVVVPNSDVKRRYSKVLPVFHGRLLTMKELERERF